MSKLSSLNTLIGLATQERDSATTMLGELRTAQTQCEQQLNELLTYRDEYQRRFDDAMAAGISMATLQNYQRFVASLDKAIEQQRGAVTSSEDSVEVGKNNWQSKQRRLKSFDTLALRRHQIAERREAKREQLQTDEYASRASSRLSGL